MRKIVSMTTVLLSGFFLCNATASDINDKRPRQQLNTSSDAKPLSQKQQRKQNAEQLKLDRERRAREEEAKKATQIKSEPPEQIKMQEQSGDGWDDFDPNIEQANDNAPPLQSPVVDPSVQLVKSEDLPVVEKQAASDATGKHDDMIAVTKISAVEPVTVSEVQAVENTSVEILAPPVTEQSWLGWAVEKGGNAIVNIASLATKSSKARHDPSGYPPIRYDTFYADLQCSFKNIDMNNLVREQINYNMGPIKWDNGDSFFPTRVSVGVFEILLVHGATLTIAGLKDRGEITLKQANRIKFEHFFECYREAKTTDDMKLFDVKYQDSVHIEYPLKFLREVQDYVEQGSSIAPFYRDVNYCHHAASLWNPITLFNHTLTKTVYRLLFLSPEGHAKHVSLHGYRVHGSLGMSVEEYAQYLKQFEETDFKVTADK